MTEDNLQLFLRTGKRLKFFCLQSRRKSRNERMHNHALFTVNHQVAQHWGNARSFSRMNAELLWRIRIARSAVNRKVGDSSPPRSEDNSQMLFRTGECLEVLSYVVAAKKSK